MGHLERCQGLPAGVGGIAWLATAAATVATAVLWAGPAVAQSRIASPDEVTAALRVLDRWVGRWRVTTRTTVPAASTVTGTSHNHWVLGRRFLQGDTGDKSDGSTDQSMMTFDAVTRAYPLWIFGSTGVVFYLADGQWDAATRTMLWKSPVNLAGSYTYRCHFPDDHQYRCASVVKDWKGSVTLALESVGTRMP